MNPSQLAMVISNEHKYTVLTWWNKLPNTEKQSLEEFFNQSNFVTSEEDGVTLRWWNTVSWDAYGPVWETVRRFLQETFDEKTYRWIRIGEKVGDMEYSGELSGAPFFLGYQRRIMFFDHTQTPRYLIGGSAIE